MFLMLNIFCLYLSRILSLLLPVQKCYLSCDDEIRAGREVQDYQASLSLKWDIYSKCVPFYARRAFLGLLSNYSSSSRSAYYYCVNCLIYQKYILNLGFMIQLKLKPIDLSPIVIYTYQNAYSILILFLRVMQTQSSCDTIGYITKGRSVRFVMLNDFFNRLGILSSIRQQDRFIQNGY